MFGEGHLYWMYSVFLQIYILLQVWPSELWLCGSILTQTMFSQTQPSTFAA